MLQDNCQKINFINSFPTTTCPQVFYSLISPLIVNQNLIWILVLIGNSKLILDIDSSLSMKHESRSYHPAPLYQH